MKCDELEPIELECNMGKDSVTGLVNREPWKAYDIDEVDAAIAELKAENKMLKEHIANGDVSRITLIDEATELKAENERLKKCEIWMKQHFYCEEVIACESAKNRRLIRALWLARAEHAADKARIFYFAATCGVLLNIDGYSNRKKGRQRLDTAMKWEHVWLKVERKCLKKAEEYK